MFSERLRTLRESDGLSQIHFAQEIGFSQAAISAWENNTREPGIEALTRIAQFFNVTIDYLVGNTSAISKKEKSPTLSSGEKELLGIYNALEKEYQAQILEYARYLAMRRGIKIKNN